TGELVVGDVGDRAEHPLGLPCGVEKRLPGCSNPALAIGPCEHAVFDVVAASARGVETALYLRFDAGLVLGANALEVILDFMSRLRFQTEHLLASRVRGYAIGERVVLPCAD